MAYCEECGEKITYHGCGCERKEQQRLVYENAALRKALGWALIYVRLPDGTDPERWAGKYNEARRLVKGEK
jgi:hypothetical protein